MSDLIQALVAAFAQVHRWESAPAVLFPAGHVLPMAVRVAWGWSDTHRELKANQGNEVIVNRIEVVLLRTGQRTLGIGYFCGRCVAYPGTGAHEPVILGRLGHRWARAVDPPTCRNQVTIGLGNLEGDGVRDGL